MIVEKNFKEIFVNIDTQLHKIAVGRFLSSIIKIIFIFTLGKING